MFDVDHANKIGFWYYSYVTNWRNSSLQLRKKFAELSYIDSSYGMPQVMYM